MAQRKINFFYCSGCDYLGPAESYYYEIACPACQRASLDGEWVKLGCTLCEYTCTVFQPGGDYTVYEHCDLPMARKLNEG